MKVFLSWSGDLSCQVAKTLRDWLPLVIQSVEPYISANDIDKGKRWTGDLAAELAATNFGIICVTKDNVDAPWVLFEAGALSKTIDTSRVAPLLLDLKASEVQGPLLQFQMTLCEKSDVKALLQSLNSTASDNGEGLDEQRLERAFEQWWPELQKSLDLLVKSPGHKRAKSSSRTKRLDQEHSSEILEEILELARGQMKLLRSPMELLPPSYLANVFLAREWRGMRPDVLRPDHPVWLSVSEAFERLSDFLDEFEDDDDVVEVGVIKERFGPVRKRLMYALRVIQRESHGRRLLLKAAGSIDSTDPEL